MTGLHEFHNWVLSRWQDVEIARKSLPEHRRDKGKGICFQVEAQDLRTVEEMIEHYFRAFPECDPRGIGVVDPDDCQGVGSSKV